MTQVTRTPGGDEGAYPEVTIGIVAALWIEGLAMRSLIGDISSVRPIAGDPNHYHIGHLPSSQPEAPHSVVVTTMPHDNTRNAAAICTNLLRSFPQVRCVIMVGIAGGIPAPAHPERHVRLGDIVVATGGVVDYSHTRQVDGLTTPRRHVDHMSEAMTRAVLTLREDEFRGKPRWAGFLDLHDNPELARRFARPRPQTDVLHVRGERIKHPDRRLTGHPTGLPKVHYGAIATGDVLLRDEAERDRLAAKYDVMAVEMEASGIAAGAATLERHWFMVRGIADYCDNVNKSDQWHPYGSFAAAAYVRAMLAACHPFGAPAALEQPNGGSAARIAETTIRRQDAVQDLVRHQFWHQLANRRSLVNILRTKLPVDLPRSPENDPAAHLDAVLAGALRTPDGLVAVLDSLAAMPADAQVAGAVAVLEELTVQDVLPGRMAAEATRILSEAPPVDMRQLASTSHKDHAASAVDGLPSSPQAAFDMVLTSFAHPDNVSTLLAMADRLAVAATDHAFQTELTTWRKRVASSLGADGPATWRPIRRAGPAGGNDDTNLIHTEAEDVGLSSGVPQGVTDTVAKYRVVHETDTSTIGPTALQDPASTGAEINQPLEPRGVPPVWGNIPPRNPHFTGRGELLDNLARRLRSTNVTAVLPQAIHGMGGVGKSQLAIEYVYRYQQQYDVIWWIPAEQPQQILAAMAEMAPELGLDVGREVNAAVPAVREALRRGRPYSNWLLVFDNAEDLSAVQNVVPTAGGYGKILVTSRNADWAQRAETLEVDVFNRDESVRLLKRRDPEINESDAAKLAEALGDLPLAIEQAASWLAATGMAAGEYLDLLKSRAELLDATGATGYYEKPVAAAWTVSLDALKETSPAAMRLLEICSFYAPEPIIRALFANAGSTARAENQDEFELALRDPIKLNKAFRDVQRYALARINHGAAGTIELHRLVQAVIRGRVEPEHRDDIRHRGHLLLAAANPGEPNSMIHADRYQALISHVHASEALTCQDPWVRQLVFDVVKFLYRWGDHEGCESLARDVYAAWSTSLGPESEETLRFAKYFGWILWVNGKFQEARDLDRATLAHYQEHFQPGDEDVIDAKVQYARDLHTEGNFAQAAQMVREALADARRSLGPDDPKTLDAAQQLGVTLRLAGEFAEALDVDEENLRQRTVVLGADDFDTLNTSNSVTIDQRELGDYNGARKSQEHLYARHRLVFGESNPQTTRAGRYLAVARRKAGDHPGALELSREIERRFRERYGESYPDTVASAMNLAVDLRQTGDLADSAELGAKTKEIYEALLGAEHPFTLSARTNQAITLRLLGDSAAALEHNEAAVEGLQRSIGEDHPLSITAATNLASDHYALGQYEKAFELDTDTLDRSRRINGAEHPSTLAVNANLALDLRAMGRVGEADVMHQDVVARYRRKLGGGHPATVAASRHVRADCDIDPMPL